MKIHEILSVASEAHELMQDYENDQLAIIDVYDPDDLKEMFSKLKQFTVHTGVADALIEAADEASKLLSKYESDPDYENEDGWNWANLADDVIRDILDWGNLTLILEGIAIEASEAINSESGAGTFYGNEVWDADQEHLSDAYDEYLSEYY